MSSAEEKEENLQNEVIQVMRSYFDLEGYTTSFTRMCAREIIEALQEREMPVRSIVENFIDRRVKYFGDTTKTVLVDELMSALGREMPTDLAIARAATEFDESECGNFRLRKAFKAGVQWCLDWMRGEHGRT